MFKRQKAYEWGRRIGCIKGPNREKKIPGNLVGETNETDVLLHGKLGKALIDTGSSISTISKDFYDTHLSDLTITPLENLLQIESATGHDLPYLGYISAELEIHGFLNKDTYLFLVTPTMSKRDDAIQILIGTNILRYVKDSLLGQYGERYMQKAPIRSAWLIALQCLSHNDKKIKRNGHLALLKSGETESVVIRPNERKTIQSYTSDGAIQPCTTAIIEKSAKSKLPMKDIEILQVAVTYTVDGKERVPVEISNHSKHTIIVSPRAIVAELQPVQVQPPPEDLVNKDSNFSADGTVNFDLSESAASGDEAEELVKFLKSWTKVFSTSDCDFGYTDRAEHEIHLTDETPVKNRYGRIPPGMFDELKNYLNQLVKAKLIRKSKSPWCSNMVIVRKPNGKIRICIDYRQINKKTIKDSYALPRIEEMLDCLKGAKFFSTIDMRSGFYHIPMKEQDKQYTAFSAGPLGFWEWNRMPLGLVNSPSTYQRLMEDCFSDLNNKICLIYLDDIIIYASTFEEHLERLGMVFQRLEECGLKLNQEKCKFFRSSVRFLGHVVDENGVSADTSKTEKIVNWPRPNNADQLRKFLGFAGYFRRFVKSFGQIAKPLYDLLGGPTKKTKKKKERPIVKPWQWSEAEESAFVQLKQCLTHPPILAYPDFGSPFKLHIDASGVGLGAILYQEQDEKDRVIAYASRGLSKSERNYPAHKLEFLSLKWAVTNKFHDYLYANNCTVFTDNNPLTYVLSTAKLDATGQRWIAALSNYNLVIKYKPGKLNTDADILSRLPGEREEREYSQEITPEMFNALCTCKTMNITTFAESTPFSVSSVDVLDYDFGEKIVESIQMRRAQVQDPIIGPFVKFVTNKQKPEKRHLQRDPETQALSRQYEKLEIKRGILYRRTENKNNEEHTYQLILPKEYRAMALTYLHDNMGHLGRDKTMGLVRDRFYWPKMSSDVEDKIKSCDRCILRKANPEKAPLINIRTTRPLELVCMDYLTLEMSKGAYENILVITDHFTRFAVAVATKNQSAKTTADVLFNQFIAIYGFPARLHSDQGATFMGQLVSELCKMTSVDKSHTTPYHAMGNGMTERFNRTLLNMMGTLEHDLKLDWKSQLPTLTHAYNCTRHDSTGFSPYYLMFGRQPKLPIDILFNLWDDSRDVEYCDYVEKLRERLHDSYRKAIEASGQRQSKQKEHYDKKAKYDCVKIGDRVLVKIVAFKGKHKIADNWENQVYKILDKPNVDLPVYVVKREDGEGPTRTLHRNLLLPLNCINDVPCCETDHENSEIGDTDTAEIDLPDELEDIESGSESEQSMLVIEDDRESVTLEVVVGEQNEEVFVAEPDSDSVSSDSEPAGEAPVPVRRSARQRKPPEKYSGDQWVMENKVSIPKLTNNSFDVAYFTQLLEKRVISETTWFSMCNSLLKT